MKIDEIYTAESVEDALRLLNSHNAIPLSAGTDLLPALREGNLAHVSLVDLHKLNELSYIALDGDTLRIGAMTTHTMIADSPLIQKSIPMLAAACGLVGSAQIRNRATIGGNIMNASPAADSVPVLVAADASVLLKTASGSESMPLSDFLVAPRRTKLPSGGLLCEIRLPIPPGGWLGGYYKVGGRTSLTIAIVSCALLSSGKGDLRVAFGSMSPSIKRNAALEQYLLQNKEATQEELHRMVCESLFPISDIRACADYRTTVAANLLWQGMYELNEGMTK